MLKLVTEHGYGVDGRGRLVLLTNPQQADVIRGFRVSSGASADFIAGEGAVPYLTTQTIVGSRPPSEVGALPVLGSYGRALVVESWLVPAGYLLATVTNGPNSQHNPIAFREHPTPNLRGLMIIAGSTAPEYPLVDSRFVRGFGTGVRNRAAGAVLQSHVRHIHHSRITRRCLVPRVDELRARMRVPIEPGLKAAFDQAAAARGAVERAWPFNDVLLNDPRVEAALLSALECRTRNGSDRGRCTSTRRLILGTCRARSCSGRQPLIRLTRPTSTCLDHG